MADENQEQENPPPLYNPQNPTEAGVGAGLAASTELFASGTPASKWVSGLFAGLSFSNADDVAEFAETAGKMILAIGAASVAPEGIVAIAVGAVTGILLEAMDTRDSVNNPVYEAFDLPNGVRIETGGLAFIDIQTDFITGDQTVRVGDLQDPDFDITIELDENGQMKAIDSTIGGQRVKVDENGNVVIGDDIKIQQQKDAVDAMLPDGAKVDDITPDVTTE
ncbi:MAG: hypothetical protein AB2692_23515, partial [Candidatus Thiodiazotropha sp.]